MDWNNHCYCAICGAPCGRVKWDLLDPDYYYPSILEEDGVNWLCDVKLLTVNRKTGKGIVCNKPEHERGTYSQPYDDSRVVTHPDNFGRGHIDVYDINENGPPVIPFHISCHKLLEKANGKKLDNKILHATFAKHCVRSNSVALNYDYGKVKKLQGGGSWQVRKGTEWVVMDPSEVQHTLAEMMLNEVTRDAPVETSADNERWQRGFPLHHGWPVIFLPSEAKLKKRCIDWRAFYYLAQDLGKGNGKFGSKKIRLAFKNRARVWRVCSAILRDYKIAAEEEALRPKTTCAMKRQWKENEMKRQAELKAIDKRIEEEEANRRAKRRAMERQSEVNQLESGSGIGAVESQSRITPIRRKVGMSLAESEWLISSSTVQSKISQFFIRSH